MSKTIINYLDEAVSLVPEKVWLRDKIENTNTDWTWQEAKSEINAIATWLQRQRNQHSGNVALLSKNRAHWLLVNMGIVASGNVSVPLFTSSSKETLLHTLSFTEVKTIFVGEAENWSKIETTLADDVCVVSLPGVELKRANFRLEDIITEFSGEASNHICQPQDMASIIFTSGTTGVPKGVVQTHESLLSAMERGKALDVMGLRMQPRFLSYLPLAHIGEQSLVWIQSLLYHGEITFCEDLSYLTRDMAECRPHYFFGAPRVWEQLQQGVLAKFGSQGVLDQMLDADSDKVGKLIREGLGLDEADCLMSSSAPISVDLLEWFERIGLKLVNGYGQSEGLGYVDCSWKHRRTGSIGIAVEGVELKISDAGELLIKAEGMSPGYYKMPEQTAETFANGWLHTGDKARVDSDGYYYITGRVKDYFKTIHGKYVAPIPIEDAFMALELVDQVCLIGRGMSKTVLMCKLGSEASEVGEQAIKKALIEKVEAVNQTVEKHMRVGVVIVSHTEWSVENNILTPTMKIRRGMIDELYHEQAARLARRAAESGEILVEL